MNKKLISLLVAICLVIGLLPAVAISHAQGAELDTAYTFGFGYLSGYNKTYTLTNYDTPVYLKNTTSDDGVTRETTTGASESDWNVKLIWHTGDEGPTAYLDGFIFDYYDESASAWIGSNGHKTIAFSNSSNTAPLTIVLQGEDSTIKAQGGFVNGADIAIRSADGAGLTDCYLTQYLVRTMTGGGDVNINADIDATITTYADGNRGPITTTKGDVNITGGTVNITSLTANARPIVVNTSGNVNISGGANVTLNNTAGGYSVYGKNATPVVTVTDASLTMNGKNGTNKAPTVTEGYCYTLMQGTNANGSNAAPVDAFEDGDKYYAVIRNHDNLTEHPATEAQVGIAGNELYYSCAKCGKYFADAKGAQEIAENSWVIDPLPEPTTSATGGALDTAYTIQFGSSSTYKKTGKLTNYDTAIYFVNATKEITIDAGTADERVFTASYTVPGGSESAYNAKLIWHTGDTGPTLYLKDYKFDLYDDIGGAFKGTKEIAINPGAQDSAKNVPLTIVLESDSLIEGRNAVTHSADLTIRSEGTAKLTGNMDVAFIRMSGGADVTVNANIDVNLRNYQTAGVGGICVTGVNADPENGVAENKANINIVGGNVKFTSFHASHCAMVINTCGDVNISGGANVQFNGRSRAVFMRNHTAGAYGQVNVNDANLVTSTDAVGFVVGTTAFVPTVAEGYCYTLKEGSNADDAEAVATLTEGKKYYAIQYNSTSHADDGNGVCTGCGQTIGGAPTTTPTSEPTTVPSSEATSEPTTGATSEPTSEPTTAPTEAPTTAPTEAPSTAPTLEADYVFQFGYKSGYNKKYTLKNYDTPIYLKNTTLDSGVIRETTTGASENDWNAKLIWHIGDNGPTLYLDGFVFDFYDEVTEAYLASDIIAVYHTNSKPLTIVLQGEDSVIKTSTGAITNNANITIRSEGTAKLIGHVGRYLVRSSAGSVNINANLDAYISTYADGKYGGLTSTNGDVNITGGKVKVETNAADTRIRPIVISASGNVNISGGAEVTLKNSAGGNSVFAHNNATPTVTVDNADLILHGAISTGAAPVTAEGFDAYLLQGSKADGSDLAEVTALEAGKKYYGIFRDSANAPEIPEPTTPAPSTPGSTNPATTAPTTAADALPIQPTLTMGTGKYVLKKYDQPIYLVNSFGTTQDTAGNEFTNCTPTKTGANEENYNLKFVWNTGDANPTIILRGFKWDHYNNETGLRQSTKTDGQYTGTAVTTYPFTLAEGVPVDIILTGEDSYIEAAFGIYTKSDLSIKSEGDTKLTMHSFTGCITTGKTEGVKLTIDANLDFTSHGYWNDKQGLGVINTYKGDITINGGNISCTTEQEKTKGITATDGGNITINAGNIVANTACNGGVGTGAICASGGKVIINNGTVMPVPATVLGIHGKLGVDINGGIVRFYSATYGINANSAEGNITINGGLVEIVSESGAFYKQPILGDGITGYAGTSFKDAKEYNPDEDYDAKYVKIGLNVAEPNEAEIPTVPGADPNNPFENPAAPSIEPTASPTAAPGVKLPKAVSVNVGGVNMQITKYDTPVYLVNSSVEVKDTEGNVFQAMTPVTGDANNWNAKFVWNSNEGIPTLYLDGLVIDDYNEETALWRQNPTQAPGTVYGRTGITVPYGRYTRVVVTGKDSQFKTSSGITFSSKLRMESEGNAKLDVWVRGSGVRGTAGIPLILNVNMSVWIGTYSSGDRSHGIIVNNADLTINGGTLKLDAGTEKSAAISVRGGGNVIVNGGTITARGTQATAYQNGTIQSLKGKIIVNGGTLNITARSASGMFGMTGIDINGGIVEIFSPSCGIVGGTKSAIANINFNGGTTTVIASKASNNSVCLLYAGPGMYAYVGAGPRSAELYDMSSIKTMQKQMVKPWILFTDDESKKINLDDDDYEEEEEDDIITDSTEATTDSTAPTTDPSVDPDATAATTPDGVTPDENIPDDEYYEDGEYDDTDYDNYYGVTPNLNIINGLSDEIPDALIEMGIDSTDMIRDILVEMVWAVDDYSDYFAFFDIKLMYHDGEDWVEADEEHYPEEGYVTVMLPYPEGTDMDTYFTAVHMFTSDAFGMTPGDVELLAPINTDEGILVELVGLSPVAIAWEGMGEYEENFQTGDTGIGLYVGLMVVAVLGMAGTVVLSNNKKKRKA